MGASLIEEAPAQPQAKEVRTKITENEAGRFVRIPDHFILEGKTIVIRQERDGGITIYPGTKRGWKVMWREFDIFKG